MNTSHVHECPYPTCSWQLEHEREHVPDAETEDAIRAHLDADHPGWTLDEVKAHADERRLEAVRRAFHLRPFGP